MNAMTLNLPQIEKQFKKRATSSRLWRERIVLLQQATHVIEEHWYELPYESRLKLAEIPADFDTRYPRPTTLGEWFAVIVRAPLSLAWSMVNGEDHATSYGLALAGYVFAVRRRIEAEAAEDAKLWNEAVKDDPDFEQAVKRGQEAFTRGEFVLADWNSQRRLSVSAS